MQVFCADTMQGTVHRFQSEDGPCQCGAVIRNRRQHERVGVVYAKPDGSKTAPVVALLDAQGGLTVSQIADTLRKPKQWVKHALTVLERAKKVARIGEREETQMEGARRITRTVAIYGLRRGESYPEDTHHAGS